MREMTEKKRNTPVIAFHGPEPQWRHELHSASREGLAMMVRSLETTINALTGHPTDPAAMLRFVRDAKKHGRIISLSKRLDRFDADPEGETRKWMRRQQAAKKAARARKRSKRRGL